MPVWLKKIISTRFFAIIFGVITAIYATALAFEVTFAIKTVFNITNTFGLVYILFFILVASTAFDVTERRKNKPESRTKVQGILNTYLIYFSFIMFFWTIVHLVPFINKYVKATGTVFIIILTAIIVFWGYIKTKKIVIKSYAVSVRKGETESRIALVSDIHSGYFVGDGHIKKLVKMINSTSPDVVLIAGDIFDMGNNLSANQDILNETGTLLSEIKARDGVYAVLGNHDPNVDDDNLKRFLNIANIHLLDNELAELEHFYLVGRTDCQNNQRISLESIISATAPDKPVIVLDHNPEFIDDAVKNNLELILCGHTHRGQFFPVTIPSRLLYGKTHFYGCHKIKNTTAIITSGAGFIDLPLRIGTNNEIVSINFKS